MSKYLIFIASAFILYISAGLLTMFLGNWLYLNWIILIGLWVGSAILLNVIRKVMFK